MLRTAIFAAAAAGAAADLPVSCFYNTTVGTWTLYAGPQTLGPDADCSGFTKDDATSKLVMRLSEPNIAAASTADGGLADGEFTLIYNQAWSAALDDTTYFAYFDYTDDESLCGQTLPGLYHESAVLPQKFGCFVGEHEDAASRVMPAPAAVAVEEEEDGEIEEVVHVSQRYLEHLREHVSWHVAEQDFFEGWPVKDANRMRGVKNVPAELLRAAATSSEPSAKANAKPLRVQDFPSEFSWASQGFVPATRNQASCGSCYTFGSTGSMASNLLMRSNGTDTAVPSPQAVVSCQAPGQVGSLSQGCDGGFPWIVYESAMDWGILTSDCLPYDESNPDGVSCDSAACSDTRVVQDFGYVGDYYGATEGSDGEAMIMQALMDHGALAVNFLVQGSFSAYTGGVYDSCDSNPVDELEGEPSPFEEVNHSVLLFGWGEYDGEKAWYVQNSWGEDWGTTVDGVPGSFMIKRGVDECSIESLVSWVEMAQA